MNPDTALKDALCVRCRYRLPCGALEADVVSDEVRPSYRVRRYASGLLVLGEPGRGEVVYCDHCAPVAALCRVCGCTSEAGCEEGCWWVEPNLCSACVDREIDAALAQLAAVEAL